MFKYYYLNFLLGYQAIHFLSLHTKRDTIYFDAHVFAFAALYPTCLTLLEFHLELVYIHFGVLFVISKSKPNHAVVPLPLSTHFKSLTRLVFILFKTKLKTLIQCCSSMSSSLLLNTELSSSIFVKFHTNDTPLWDTSFRGDLQCF